MAAVSFKCPGCSKILRTSNAPPPGRKVKCPACAEVFLPSFEDEAITTAPARAAVKASPRRRDDDEDRPRSRAGSRADIDDEVRPRRGRRRDDDEDDEDEDRPRSRSRRHDDDDEDDRPRRKRRARKKTSNLPLILSLAGGGLALVLLFVMTAFVWPGFLRGRAGGFAPAAGNDPLAFLPPGGNLAVGFNLAQVRDSPEFKKGVDWLMQKAGEQGDQKSVEAIKTLLPEAERMVVMGGTLQKERAVLVVQMRGAVDQGRFIKLFGGRTVSGIKEATVYRSDPDPKTGKRVLYTFPSDRLIVCGIELGEPEFGALLQSAKANAPAPVKELARKVDGATVWMAMLPDENMRAGFGNMGGPMGGPMGKGPRPMGQGPAPGQAPGAMPDPKNVKGVTMRADLGQGVKLQLGIVCQTPAEATQVTDAVKKAWDQQGKMMLPLMAGMMGPQKLPNGRAAPNLQPLIQDVIQSFSIQAVGDSATMSIQISDASLNELRKAIQ